MGVNLWDRIDRVVSIAVWGWPGQVYNDMLSLNLQCTLISATTTNMIDRQYCSPGAKGNK